MTKGERSGKGEQTGAAEQSCLAVLETALGGGPSPDLGGFSEAVLDGALRALVRQRGTDTVTLLRRLADEGPSRVTRKAARRAIYRLTQSGVDVPPAPPSAPLVKRDKERAVRAWLSGIDGSGSRAVWIVFEGGVGGGLRLCSLILNDEAGVLEAAGGPITKKRLEIELATLREDQKLPWVETAPDRTCALVSEALALHERMGVAPPAEFDRWRPLFGSMTPSEPAGRAAEVDGRLLERSAELLALPELLGWFVDPAAIHEESLARLEMQDSRLVVSDQIKAEREAAIVDKAVGRAFSSETRPRWARRLEEMALVFRATSRDEQAGLAEAAAAALRDDARPAEGIPLVRAMALRGLEVAGEVALGRVKLDDVSRAPVPRSRAAAAR